MIGRGREHVSSPDGPDRGGADEGGEAEEEILFRFDLVSCG
jgi:hypothetical protein